MSERRRSAAAFTAGVALLVAACADDGNDGRSFARRAAEGPDAVVSVVVPVVALDNSFRPELIEVDVGDEVMWENRGLNDHDVLSVEGDGWGIEVEGFGPGATYTHVFTEPGQYRYFCSIHGNESVGMVGTVVVRG